MDSGDIEQVNFGSEDPESEPIEVEVDISQEEYHGDDNDDEDYHTDFQDQQDSQYRQDPLGRVECPQGAAVPPPSVALTKGSGSFGCKTGCVIPHCRLAKYSTSFHRVPSNATKRARWSKALQIDLPDPCTRENARRKVVLCSGHFTKDDYQRDLKAELMPNTKHKNTLKDWALPSQFITKEENQKIIVVEKRGRPHLYQRERVKQKNVLQAVNLLPSLTPLPPKTLQDFKGFPLPSADLSSLRTNPTARSVSPPKYHQCKNIDCNLEKLKLREENRQLRVKMDLLQRTIQDQQNDIVRYLRESAKAKRRKTGGGRPENGKTGFSVIPLSGKESGKGFSVIPLTSQPSTEAATVPKVQQGEETEELGPEKGQTGFSVIPLTGKESGKGFSVIPFAAQPTTQAATVPKVQQGEDTEELGLKGSFHHLLSNEVPDESSQETEEEDDIAARIEKAISDNKQVLSLHQQSLSPSKFSWRHKQKTRYQDRMKLLNLM